MSDKKDFWKSAYFIIFFAFIINYFNATLATDTFNVITPVLEKTFGWTRGQINYPATIGTLLSIATYFIFGTLIIKFGIKKIMVLGFFLLGMAQIWMANAATLASYSAAMVLTQAAVPAILTSSFALSANWFMKLRGRVLGFVTIGAPLGSASFIPIMTKLIENYGYTTVYSGLGVVVILFGLGAIWLTKNTPEEIGVGPDGEAWTEEELRAARTEYKPVWTPKKLFATKEAWYLMLIFGFYYLIITAIMSTLVPRLLDVGLPINQILVLLPIGAISAIPLSYIWGWLDDKIGTIKTTMVFSLTFIFMSFCLVFASAENMLFTYLVFFGMASMIGGLPNLHPSCTAWVYGRKEFVNANRYLSIGQMVFRALGFSVMAFAFDRFGSYNAAYYLFMVMAIAAIMMLGAIKVTYDPERLKLQQEQQERVSGDTMAI